MSVVFTDTGCDVLDEFLQEYDIKEIFMPFCLADKEYTSKEQIGLKNFYEQLRKGASVSTSSLNPHLYTEIFEPYLQKGLDIIYIHFSSQMSGTWNQLDIALKELRKKYPNRQIDAVDSLNISAGAGLLAIEVAKRNRDGMPHKELVNWAKQNRNQFSTYFYVDSLKHLRKGGRISAATAFVGSVLNIKPVLHCTSSGKLKILDKAIGKKKAMLELVNYAKKYGKNLEKYPFIILHSDAEEQAEELKIIIRETLGANFKIYMGVVGTTVGTHCGPGTIALFFHGTQLILE